MKLQAPKVVHICYVAQRGFQAVKKVEAQIRQSPIEGIWQKTMRP